MSAQGAALPPAYELGIEAGGSRVQLDIYRADTGAPLWSGIIAETGSTPDARFDTNNDGVPGTTAYLPDGILVLAFTPVSCGTTPGCVPLATPITYAWAGNSVNLPAGSFYRPAAGTRTDVTNFSMSEGTLKIRTDDARVTDYITAALGERGWTLPYDRTILCNTVACDSDGAGGFGPRGQFFSAGVTTTTVAGQPTWRRLVPTFTFKGIVYPPTTWPDLTWNVPGLTLKFNPTAYIQLRRGLTTAGTLFTAASMAQGWRGMEQLTGSTVSLTAGTVVENVSMGSIVNAGGGSVRVLGGVLTVDNSTIQNALPDALLFGLYVSRPGSSALVRNGSNISGHRLGGISADQSAFVNVWGSTLSYTSTGQYNAAGLTASSATIWVSDSEITGSLPNNSRGVQATGQGHVSFDFTGAGQPPIVGPNTVVSGNGVADLTANGGLITSGSGSSYRRNSFVSASTQLRALNESSVSLVFNYWGQATGPDLARVTVDPKSTFSYCQDFRSGGALMGTA